MIYPAVFLFRCGISDMMQTCGGKIPAKYKQLHRISAGRLKKPEMRQTTSD